jgi:uncharacterized membrane protein YfcA
VAVAGVFVVWQGMEFLWLLGRQPSFLRPRDSSQEKPRLTRGRVSLEGGIGLAVGLVGGAVGLILGSIRLPAMIRILNMDPRMAAGTNLFVGFLLGSFGFFGHALKGEFSGSLLLAMTLPGMVGTYLGAKLTGKVSLRSLMLVMAFVLVAVGSLLILDAYGRWR